MMKYRLLEQAIPFKRLMKGIEERGEQGRERERGEGREVANSPFLAVSWSQCSSRLV